MKKIIFSLMLILGLAFIGGGGLLLANSLKLAFGSVIWPLNYKNYVFQDRPTPGMDDFAPSISPMPDLAPYTMDALIRKIPQGERGKIYIGQMEGNVGFDKFTEIRRQKEFSELQNRQSPIAIRIMSGVYDLESLYRGIDDNAVLSRDGDTYLLHIPLYVGPDATFIIRGQDKDHRLTLKMSSITGGFLVNGGTLFIVDANIVGWNDRDNTPSAFQGEKRVRPFLTSWSASQTYLGRSGFYDLGYSASKSYGVSFSSLKPLLKANPQVPAPKGWLVECWFEGLYYGFYSYEAKDVALVNNIYANNIIYGIDPHDRSSNLLIAGNEAYGTKKKHGIIVSREVNDSWIVNNYSHDNHGSGFMLDRTSVRNLVANNLAFRNGNDGLTLFESGHNVIRDNKFILNGRSGLRVRNSANVVAERNLYFLNKTNGVQAYAFDITKSEDDRDFEEDPFTQYISVTVSDSLFVLNGGAMFKFNDTDLVRLSGVRFPWYHPQMMRGDYDNLTYEVAVGLRKSPHFVEIRKTGESRDSSALESPKESGDGDEGEPD